MAVHRRHRRHDRAESGTELAVRYALKKCEEQGAETKLYAGPAARGAARSTRPSVPSGRTSRPSSSRTCASADGIIIGSSSYHGTIAGLIKNALDYTQDMMKDDRPYFAGRPVGLHRHGGRAGRASSGRSSTCGRWSTRCAAGRRRSAPRSTRSRRHSARTASRSTRRSPSSSKTVAERSADSSSRSSSR